MNKIMLGIFTVFVVHTTNTSGKELSKTIIQETTQTDIEHQVQQDSQSIEDAHEAMNTLMEKLPAIGDDLRQVLMLETKIQQLTARQRANLILLHKLDVAQGIFNKIFLLQNIDDELTNACAELYTKHKELGPLLRPLQEIINTYLFTYDPDWLPTVEPETNNSKIT